MTQQPNDEKSAKAARVPSPTQAELTAEILRARAELAATVDALATRLSPKTLAAEAAESTKQAASDAGAFLTGGGLPTSSPSRARNAKIVLGLVASIVAVTIIKISKRKK